MNTKTILLLPHADTQERLLAPGAPVCFWDPEYAGWFDAEQDFGWVYARGIRWDDGSGTTEAPEWQGIHLVLACDGTVAPEGSDRLGRCRRSPDRTATDRLIRLALDGDPDPLRLVCRDLGEVVVVERPQSLPSEPR